MRLQDINSALYESHRGRSPSLSKMHVVIADVETPNLCAVAFEAIRICLACDLATSFANAPFDAVQTYSIEVPKAKDSVLSAFPLVRRRPVDIFSAI